MTRSSRWLGVLLAVAILLCIGLIVAEAIVGSYTGRKAIVATQRSGCIGFSRAVLVPLANALRANERTHNVLARDSRVSSATRDAARADAAQERWSLRQIDRRIDASATGLNARDAAIIRALGVRAFSCERQYPAAPLLQI